AKFHTITKIDQCESCRAEWFATFREEEQEKAGEAVRLYDDAQEMLHRFVDEDAAYIKAVFGIYEAYSENDTLYLGETSFPFLRQQKKNSKNAYYCLSDFTAPRTSGVTDYVGAFAVTAGTGADEQL